MAMKTPDQILSAGITKLVELRPRALDHVNLRTGVYWHPFAAQRAMIALALQRVSAMLEANTLQASGQDLVDYINSEYTQILSQDLEGTQAVGDVYFVRNTGPLLAGDIPKGTRITRQAYENGPINWPAADYVTLADVHVNAGAAFVSVAVQATTVGAGPNCPRRASGLSDYKYTVAGRPLFDTAFQPTELLASGGADPIGTAVGFRPVDLESANEFLRKYALAFSKGSSGPTRDAAIYGAIRGTGGRFALTYDDPDNGALVIAVADSSWSSSPRWCAAVQQSIFDAGLVGFGCRIDVRPVRNKVVYATANITLRDWSFTTDTLAIDEAIRDAVQSYFDDRPDFNVIRNHALKNAITRAHPKILKCSSVTLVDEQGAPITDVSLDYTVEQFHYLLPAKAVTTTYIGPG